MATRITTATLLALNTTIRTTFFSMFDATSSWADKLCEVVPSESASNTYPVIADPGQIRLWEGGERVVNSLQLGSFQIYNKRYEKTLGINRDHLADDMTGMLLRSARSIGSKFRKFRDRRIIQIISDNPTCLDGVAFFHASAHERNPAAPDGNTYGNISSSKPLSAANVAAVRAAMMTRRGPDAEIVDCDPRLIIVPPELEVTADQIINGMLILDPTGAAAESNAQRGKFRSLVIPELSALSSTTWYLADDTGPDMPFIVQPRDALELVMMFDPSDPSVFNRNEYVWGATIREGFGPGNPWKIQKCTA